MIIDSKHVNDNVRMKLLREEEEHLGLWQEFPSPELVSARLVQHQKPVESLPGEPVAHEAAKANQDHEQAQAAVESDSRLHGEPQTA